MEACRKLALSIAYPSPVVVEVCEDFDLLRLAFERPAGELERRKAWAYAALSSITTSKPSSAIRTPERLAMVRRAVTAVDDASGSQRPNPLTSRRHSDARRVTRNALGSLIQVNRLAIQRVKAITGR